MQKLNVTLNEPVADGLYSVPHSNRKLGDALSESLLEFPHLPSDCLNDDNIALGFIESCFHLIGPVCSLHKNDYVLIHKNTAYLVNSEMDQVWRNLLTRSNQDKPILSPLIEAMADLEKLEDGYYFVENKKTGRRHIGRVRHSGLSYVSIEPYTHFVEADSHHYDVLCRIEEPK